MTFSDISFYGRDYSGWPEEHVAMLVQLFYAVKSEILELGIDCRGCSGRGGGIQIDGSPSRAVQITGLLRGTSTLDFSHSFATFGISHEGCHHHHLV